MITVQSQNSNRTSSPFKTTNFSMNPLIRTKMCLTLLLYFRSHLGSVDLSWWIRHYQA